MILAIHGRFDSRGIDAAPILNSSNLKTNAISKIFKDGAQKTNQDALNVGSSKYFVGSS